jgi:molecular chaperone HtpG
MATNENPDGAFPVRVDFERILETIAARIYDNQFAFLRENVQNAIDAVRIQAKRDGRSPGDAGYEIRIDVSNKECRISDNGIGMTRGELQANFWTMGASGKNTPEARAAGCIGTFGIGGFANFGVCETLEVTSRSQACAIAHQTSLSRAAFSTDRYELPKVAYAESTVLSQRGTVVRGIGKEAFDVAALSNYLSQFVRHVREAVFFNGKKLSQAVFEIAPGKKPLCEDEARDGLAFRLYVDGDFTISAELLSATIEGRAVECKGYVRLVQGSLDVYKRGFRICSVNVPSRIGVSGWIDCDQVRPTAGRDTLDGASMMTLTRLFQAVEAGAKDHVLRDSELLGAHIRLIPDFMQQGLVARLGHLAVDLIGGASMELEDIRKQRTAERRVFFTSSGAQTPATEVLSARGHFIVRLSGNRQRRSAEVEYLSKFCDGQELDGLIDCLEVYTHLDSFERSVLTEIDFAVRKLFKPPEFKLVAGKLTLDTPIFWTDKKDRNAIIVYVDPRHGEFQKLKPLGFSALFWSMIEAFCREYLGDTLRRQSVKLFGSGAIDLDAFSKANSELWELVLDDIEVSRIGLPEAPAARPGGGRYQIVRRQDIAQVTISSDGVTATPAVDVSGKEAPKLLRIVDETESTGLAGYYLRIPVSATAAFGDIVRTFPQFGVVWFANRVTWQGCDPTNATAFLFDITLDRFVGADDGGLAAHGAMELVPSQVQTYEGQIYFFIPAALQDRIIPRDASDVIKLQVRHELVDLHHARAWTSKEPSPKA